MKYCINKLSLSDAHGLLAGISDQKIHFVDLRTKTEIFTAYNEGSKPLSFDFKGNGLNYAVGTEDGQVFEFDMRSRESPVRAFQVGCSIENMKYNGNYVICSAHDILNIFSEDSLHCKIDAGFKINCFTFDEALILCGGESDKLLSFYVPDMDRAPVWCSNIAYQ